MILAIILLLSWTNLIFSNLKEIADASMENMSKDKKTVPGYAELERTIGTSPGGME